MDIFVLEKGISKGTDVMKDGKKKMETSCIYL